jgi:predicted GNAT family acetyltransferase
MKKYLITATFEWNEEMMELVQEHRKHINSLIDEQVIEHYVVSMEIQTVWITLNAKTKREARNLLTPSPFFKHWKIMVNELMVWDGQNYRLPAVQLN